MHRGYVTALLASAASPVVAFSVTSRFPTTALVVPSTSRAVAATQLPIFSDVFGASRQQTSRLHMSASPAEFVKSEVESNEVVVFSKTFCPFCMKTKQLFEEMKVDAKIIELDTMDEGPNIQAALLDYSGQRTVPNVFIKGKHLGGNDDTQAAAQSGALAEMLK